MAAPLHQTDNVRSGPEPAGSSSSTLELLLRRRWTVLVITTVVTMAAAVTAFILPNKYEASVEVSPVDYLNSGRGSAVSSVMSQFGNLASLAGVMTPGVTATAREEALATLQSATLTQRFIDENALLPVLFSGQWNAATKQWTGTKPTLWKANRYFQTRVRSVVENKKSGLVTVSITWTDAGIAAAWANKLVQMTNEYLRSKAIADSERNIAYLSDQVARTNVVEMQKAIYSLMEAELRKAMLARGSDEYALKVIDRAFPPEKPVSPSRILWIVAGFFGGFLTSLVVIFADRTLKDARQRRPVA